jgi:hypothetical protein
MIQLRRTTTYASGRDGASDATSNRHYRPRYRRFRRKRRGALPAIFSVTRAVWVIASSTSGFGPLRQFAAARQYVGYRGIADFASHPPGRFMGSRPSLKHRRAATHCGALHGLPALFERGRLALPAMDQCDARAMSLLGHQLPRPSSAGAAGTSPTADTKANNRRDRFGP